jgi:hypothetical protein
LVALARVAAVLIQLVGGELFGLVHEAVHDGRLQEVERV